MHRISLLAICIAVLVPLTIGYNLDLGSYIRHTGERGSMFGFSIALHKFQRSGWVVIGAPKGDTSNFQPGVTKGGAVYRCEILDDDRCYMIPFDSKGNQKNLNGEQIDTKSNQWLGATVASSGDSNIVVACAPRYVFNHMQPRKVERIEPVGTCFTSTNFTSFTEFSPCRTHHWGYHRQGYCQAGFSAALSKTGDRLYVGAPGAWYWQGQVWSINTEARYPYKPQWGQEFGTGGAIFSQDIGNPKHNAFHTKESSEPYDDSYLGYSMTMGDFDGDGEDDVAVGMPRGSQLMGKIVINKWNMENLVNITGWQLGAYFGYSIAAVDVDGDKLTDLIIGAPMYTEPNNEGRYEVGRVYVLLQTRQRSFKPEIFRDGFGNKGRFGLSLASLGDINLDGYGDFAVGAPYDGPQGRGAVYIYHGSSTGPLEKPSQVIYAEDLVGTTVPKTFGFSLSGGVDMDDNAYPDMAVGAYDSDSVFIFKSRPVAIIDASTQFTSASKLISLDDKRCTLHRYGKQVPCTEVESCIRYDGKNLPPILDFEVSWVLDSKKTRNPRMFFMRDENKNNIRNSTYRLERGRRFCLNETVYLVEGIRDKLTPLEVEMRYQLRGNRNKITTRRKRELLEPVIDQNREIIQRDSINIQKNCGSDNICIPDLRLNIETVDKFLLGSKDPLSIKVLITNNGEDAFEAGFYLTIPDNLYYRRWEPISNVKDVPITCSGPSATSNNTVKCDLGNPLPANQVAEFKVVFIPTHKSGMSPSYDFYMEANSTNAELGSSTFDNIIKKSIGIWIETEIQIEGNSFPSEDYYNAAEYKTLEAAKNESELGPHIVHLYNIRNNGTSIIDQAVVFIHYPYRTEGNDTLLYLLNQPETSRNIQCEKTINANPYNLILDRNLQRSYNLVNLTGTAKSSAHYQPHVELSNAPSSTSAVSRTKILTAEEKKRLSEEENQESDGDASYIHSQRANDASVATASFGSRPPATVVYKNQLNRTTYYDSDGVPHVVETSTELYSPRGYNVQYGQKTSGSDGQSSGSAGQQITYTGQNRYDDKVAGAGQGGFRAGVLDLGSANRNNVDEELHKQASSGRYQQSQEYTPSGHYQQSSSWSSGDPGIQTEYHDFQDNNNHYEYANKQDVNNRQYQTQQEHQTYQRGKRDTFEHNTPCRAAQCETLRCVVSNLENDNNDGSYILIRMRLLAKTAEKIAPKAPLKISTMAISHITKLPYIGTPKDDKIQSHEIFFVANPTPEQVPDVVPLWVVILAACAGALILLLLAFLLYKCGFFNRNRPTDHSQERQPLNSRNGYH